MQMRETRDRHEPLVDARVVLHRARAERVEARVDSEVPRRQLREVSEDLRLGELRQTRRLRAAELLRHVDLRQTLVARRLTTAAPWLRLLVDELHAATCSSTSASRSMSVGVRFSVTHTRKASSRPGDSR